MKQSGIILNTAQRYWYYEEEPRKKYSFTNPLEMQVFSVDVKAHHDSPTTKAISGMSKFIEYVEGSKVSPLPSTPEVLKEIQNIPTTTQECYAPKSVRAGTSHAMEINNDYSPHSIQNIFRAAIPTDQTTPSNTSRLFGPPVKARPTEGDAYLDSIFLPLYNVEARMLSLQVCSRGRTLNIQGDCQPCIWRNYQTNSTRKNPKARGRPKQKSF